MKNRNGFRYVDVEYHNSTTSEGKKAICCKITARFKTQGEISDELDFAFFKLCYTNKRRKRGWDSNEIFMGVAVLSDGETFNEKKGKEIAFKKAKKQMFLLEEKIFAYAAQNALHVYQELKTCRQLARNKVFILSDAIDSTKSKEKQKYIDCGAIHHEVDAFAEAMGKLNRGE